MTILQLRPFESLSKFPMEHGQSSRDSQVQLCPPPPETASSIQAELEEWRLRAEEQRPLAELLANSEKRLQDTDLPTLGEGKEWEDGKGPEVPKKWECRIFGKCPKGNWIIYIYIIYPHVWLKFFFDRFSMISWLYLVFVWLASRVIDFAKMVLIS